MTRAKCRASRGVNVVRAQRHARSITGSVGCANVASISGDRPVAVSRQEALGMTDPTPDEVPPVTTPVDPEVLATPDSGLDWRPGPPKQVVIIGGGLAGLVAAYELQAPGPRRRSCSRRRTASAAASTRCATFAPGLYAEAGGDAHPARPRPDARVLRRMFGLPLRPFVMGNPEGPRPHRRRAHDRRRRRTRDPARLPFELDEHERGKTADELWERRDRATCARWSSSDGDAAWERDRARVRPVLALRVPAHEGLVARARSSTTRS